MNPKPFKPSLYSRALGYVSPSAAIKRINAERTFHEFSYDAAQFSNSRNRAPQNINPNDYQKQRDRLQLMREAIDLVANFAPAKSLVKKYAMYVAPTSYSTASGDSGLDRDVDDYLHNHWFKELDVTGRFNFFQLAYFAVMHMLVEGDYGWSYLRIGSQEGMSDEEISQLPLKIMTVEADRLGGLYQNVVAPNYVGGILIGEWGEPVSYRVFKRSVTVGQYTEPVDVPARNFIHYFDPMRNDSYRGITALETAIVHLRDFYELNEFLKAKAKIAGSMTVFTNSPGAYAGPGAMDPYAVSTYGNQTALAQDVKVGQINHLPDGQQVSFPETSSPGSSTQWLMQTMLKLTAMSLNLPYSFAIDAVELGGVSGRLESEQAKAEFKRGRSCLHPHVDRLKNVGLLDAVAKGHFSPRLISAITKGRWGYLPHPQPDLGKEATAQVSLYQNGLLNPLEYWQDNDQSPETVADAMAKWVTIKNAAAKKYGIDPDDAFGKGPIAPGTQEKGDDKAQGVPQKRQFDRPDNYQNDPLYRLVMAIDPFKPETYPSEYQSEAQDLLDKWNEATDEEEPAIEQEMDTLCGKVQQELIDQQKA